MQHWTNTTVWGPPEWKYLGLFFLLKFVVVSSMTLTPFLNESGRTVSFIEDKSDENNVFLFVNKNYLKIVMIRSRVWECQ